MRVYGGQHSSAFVARATTPALAVGDKESLLWCESSDRLQLLALRIVLPRHVGQDQSAQVGDIFAQGQLSVDPDVVHSHILRILIGNATGALLKRFGIF